MINFFFAPNSCALASHIALEQSGLAYTAKRLDFSKNEQRAPEYLKINPKGRVPALVTERGVLTENPAILAWVAQSAPAKRLMPADPWDFAQAQSFNAYLCATVHVAHAHKFRGSRWADDPAAHESMKKKVPQTVGECFEIIEREMLQGPWVMGEQYTVCDAYLFTIARWLEGDGVDPGRFPKVAALRNRMSSDPALAGILALH